MGLIDIFNASDSSQIKPGSKEGEQIEKRSGAFNSSQMHAQGNFGQEAEGFGKVNKGFVAKNQEEATNVKYKTTGEYSEFDLDGKTPSKYTDNLPG